MASHQVARVLWFLDDGNGTRNDGFQGISARYPVHNDVSGGGKMDQAKLLGEYLEHALKFERMAAEATDPKLRQALEGQAQAYRRMAAKRAQELGLPAPPPPKKP